MAYETIPLTPLTGSEVRIDKGELLKPETGKALRKLLIERGVLVFRQIDLTDEEQVTLAGLIGTVRPEGEKGVMKVTLDTRLNATANYLKGSFLWHMDGTHDSTPVFASLLSGRRLSTEGGQTMFANTYAAYDALPEETKQQIQALRAVHSFEVSMNRAGVIAGSPEEAAYFKSIPTRAHKLAWPHENGRKSLVIGCHASHIEGMEESEGAQLLDELVEWATQPRFVYKHEWQPGDLLIWDNTGVMHRVEPYPLESGRLMHRTTLMGEEAFA